jgi:hypothetical protein
MRRIALLAAVAAASLSGCAVVPDRLDACVTHVSHPLRGAPFGPANEEDALDTVGACAEWQVSDRVTIDQSLAYKYADGGFYGDDFVYLGRVRVKLWSKEER